MAEIKTFTDRDKFWDAVETVAGSPERLVMSGGSAANFLDEVFLPDEVEVFLADERCVGTDDENSNAKLIREKLKGQKFIDQLDFYKPGLSAQECAAEYELQLKTENKFLFDLVVLGVGPDGHTASLFPYSASLQAKTLTAVAHTDEFAIRDRLTLTFASLRMSKTILVLLQGKGKQEIFETITNNQTDGCQFPASQLLDFSQAHIYWLNT